MKRLHTDIPSRQEVEFALEALAIEENREREAIRKFYDRERAERRYQVTWKTVLGIFLVFTAVATILLIAASEYLSQVGQ